MSSDLLIYMRWHGIPMQTAGERRRTVSLPAPSKLTVVTNAKKSHLILAVLFYIQHAELYSVATLERCVKF